MSERPTIDELLARARAGLRRLSAREAHAAAAARGRLVDVRCGDVRSADGVIPGAIHVPLDVLEWRVDPTSEHRNPELAPDYDAQLILVCTHGYSSSLAAARLHELGLVNTTDVIGGFEAWIAAGLPVEPAPPAPGRAAGTAQSA